MTIDRTPKPCLHKEADHQHGTYAAYTLDRCRCLPCAFACSVYGESLRGRHARGDLTMVDPGPAAAHITALVQAGWTLRWISATSGISQTTVQRINSDTRSPTLIKSATEAAILAVGDEGTGRYMIPAIGAVRRIQALATLGWSFKALATKVGMTQRNLVDINTGVVRNIRPPTYQSICRVYDLLWDKPAPRRRDGITDRMIRYAARNNWAPPMAWDDETIDQPDAQPNLQGEVDAGRRDLYLTGMSDIQIAREEGVSRDAIRVWRKRNGLEPNYKPRGRNAS